MNRTFCMLAIATLCASSAAPVAISLGAQSSAAADSVLAELRHGGLVLVFRHAHTDRSKMDDNNWSLADRTTQRNLSERGVEESKGIGAGMAALGIRVGQVLASPMYRTRETAEHAFGRVDTTEFLRSRRTAPEALALLTSAPEAGVNRVLVTHNAYIMHHFTSRGHGEIAEGEAIVVRPLGVDGFTVLRRIKVGEWAAFSHTERGGTEPQRQRLTMRAFRM
ncbi:MAG TPA: histidine phosphatase family protein [Gemmatimonadaceae bacterium]|nr:histidine phosphatase family protein [Gemmatimonadaceae bacterium]